MALLLNNMIYYLPLEYIDRRYTVLLDKWMTDEFKKQKKRFVTIQSDMLKQEIKTGSFLDSDGTNYFKFGQLREVCKLFKDGKVKDGDVFWLSDVWFPGIEAIKYMAYFHKITVKIKGLLWAGSFTETDFVRGMEDWAKWIEIGWFKMIDTIFCTSAFQRSELVEKGRVLDFLRIETIGAPFNYKDYYKIVPYKEWKDKEDLVVFVGRLVDEKMPWVFDRMEKHFRGIYPNVRFIKTMEVTKTKKEYLELLSRAKVVFSSALQENFGYAVLEGCAYNCNLVLPNRLAYPEMYPAECLYGSDEHAVNKIIWALKRPQNTLRFAKKQRTNVERIVKLV